MRLNVSVYLNILKFSDASEYLSGNVREKLFSAEFAAKSEPEYQRNVEALKAVIPEKIGAEDINAQIGAGWIENQEYGKFLQHLGLKNNSDGAVTRSGVDGSYKVTNSGTRQFWGGDAENATAEWGTARCSAYKIFENLLNSRDIKVYDQVTENGKKKRVLNREATLEAKTHGNQLYKIT